MTPTRTCLSGNEVILHQEDNNQWVVTIHVQCPDPAKPGSTCWIFRARDASKAAALIELIRVLAHQLALAANKSVAHDE